MYKDERDLLDVLKAELAFLEKGGYGRSPHESWRQPLIFEDSPTCMNFDSTENPGPYSDQFEVEEVFGNWLRKTIAKIEETRQALLGEGPRTSAPGSGEAAGARLSQKLHPKCANPACPTAFRWLAGGKFFRFRPESVASHSNDEGAPSHLGIPGVEHFWLCDRCSHVFTLAFEEDQGVVLKLLYPVLFAAEHPKQLTSG